MLLLHHSAATAPCHQLQRHHSLHSTSIATPQLQQQQHSQRCRRRAQAPTCAAATKSRPAAAAAKAAKAAAKAEQKDVVVPLPAAELIEQAAAADSLFQCNTVQWYPGHIAKAERQLREQLKMVDLVLEVRDARIPFSTHHPQVAKWIGSKPRLVILNRMDMVSRADRAAWEKHYAAEAAAAQQEAQQAAARKQRAAAAAAGEQQAGGASQQQQDPQQQQQQDPQQQQQQEEEEELQPPTLPQQVFWTDGKSGSGIHGVKRAAVKLSDYINARRARRGLAARPVRCCVIGFPNIGKSALINRLLGRKVVESAARPGVTRVLRWVRMGGDLDLLDAPGIIPASFDNQAAAQALAMCNDIGEASYVDSLIAAALLIRIKALPRNTGALSKLARRYKLHPLAVSGEEFVARIAGEMFGGDKEKAGVRLLTDFRNGHLGSFALELPPAELQL